MDENIKIDDNIYPLILIFNLTFIVIFLVYLSLVISYIIKNYHRKKLCIFWIDYCSLISGGVFFTIIYSINLISHGKDRITNPVELSESFYPPAVVISLSFMCFTLIGTLIFDGYISVRLAIKMHKMKLIMDMDLYSLADKFNRIDYADILKMNSHHIYNIVFFIINIALITLEGFAYTNVNPEKFDSFWNLKHFFDYLLRFYHFVVLIIIIFCIWIMNQSKKSLLEKNYYNPNRIAQKVYDAHFSQIVYFTDVISFKLVTDLIMNIPPLLFMATAKFDTFNLNLSILAIFLYILLGGSEYFMIDKDSEAGERNKLIDALFLLKCINFHFGEKDARKIIDDFKFDYSKEEQKIIDDLNINIIKNVEYNLSKDENDINDSVEMKSREDK